MPYALNLQSIVQLFDESTSPNVGADVSSINGIVGEELLLEVYCYYMVRERSIRHVSYDHSCPKVKESLAHTRWKKLDGIVNWLDSSGQDQGILVECKNWTGHSFGTRKIALNCTLTEQNDASVFHWNNLVLEVGNYKKHIAKVAYPITKESKHCDWKRLLLMWLPVCSDPSSDLVSSMLTCPNGNGEVEVFSASNYVRKLIANGISHVDLNLNGYSRRRKHLITLGL